MSRTVEVDEARAELICVPRRRDPRFDYRVAHIPAASHPTLAALMPRVAAPRPGELVWDPSCGCGAELVECSELAADLELLGTDHDPHAIVAARANLAAAGLDRARLRVEEIDVFAGSPAPATAGIIVVLQVLRRPRPAIDDNSGTRAG